MKFNNFTFYCSQFPNCGNYKALAFVTGRVTRCELIEVQRIAYQGKVGSTVSVKILCFATFEAALALRWRVFTSVFFRILSDPQKKCH